jgi:hypothetical protein
MILRNARSALFPGNAPAPPRAIPTAEESLLLRRKCAVALLELVPLRVQYVYFGRSQDFYTRVGDLVPFGELEGDEKKRAKEERKVVEKERRIGEVEGVLDCFGDNYANKHLVYGLIEVIIVRLMPELGEKGVGELMAERFS